MLNNIVGPIFLKHDNNVVQALFMQEPYQTCEMLMCVLIYTIFEQLMTSETVEQMLQCMYICFLLPVQKFAL